MYINFQQNQVCKLVKTVHTNLFAKIASCINLQLTIIILKNRLFQTCMYHCKTYLHINVQQNRLSRSVKTVHTKVTCKKKYKIHKFSTKLQLEF